jgi:putative NADH-flavin reductase
MKITIFGATGRTGIHLVQTALDAGHEVVAFARTPSKLGLQHPRLRVAAGDILDAAAVEQAIAGADAVVSVLGPTSNRPEFTVSRGMAHIISAMHKHGVRRLVISAGAGVGDPQDSPKLFNHFISFMLRLVSKNVVADMEKVVEQVRASNLDWTIVRVPMLTDQPKSGHIRIGWVGSGTGARLSRADMADFIFGQVEDRRYLRQAPVISN